MPLGLGVMSEADFNRALQEIDDLMASRGEKIQGRELRGWLAFCSRCNLRGISMFDPLSERVFQWFSARYGERLNLDTDFGQSVLRLKGDVIRFRCAGFYGRVLAICCPQLMHSQFVEKFLKAYIEQQGAKFARVHKLTELADQAESLGLRQVDRNKLALVQCSPDVRYKSSIVTRDAALVAHHIAIAMCSMIAEQLSAQSGWKTGVLSRASTRLQQLPDIVSGILIARTKQPPPFDQQLENEL